MDLQALVNDAFARHQAGRFDEALRLYRAVLAVHPPIALVLSLAGDAASTSGQPAMGARFLKRALLLEPGKSSFHQLLAFAEASRGDRAAAEESYATAVHFDPGNVSAMSDWANLIRIRQPDKARSLIRRCVLAHPERADYLKHLGELTAPHDYTGGRRMLGHVVRMTPVDAGTWKHLGSLELAEGQELLARRSLIRSLVLSPGDAWVATHVCHDHTVANEDRNTWKALRWAVCVDPRGADAWVRLSNWLHARGRNIEAGIGYQRAILLAPDDVNANANHLVLVAERDFPAAQVREGYRRTFRVRPAATLPHFNYTKFLSERGDYTDAIYAARRALVLAGPDLDMLVGLANGLRQSRLHEQAARALRWAGAALPDAPNIQSGLLMGHNYETGVSAASLFQRHRAWATEKAPAEEPLGYEVDSRPDRVLHLGFLSPDMKRHPVGFFLLPLLKTLDRSQFRVTVYSDTGSADLFTEELQRYAEHWVDSSKESDPELRERIIKDRVDILFDLAGHSAGNRIRLFARRAAPLQMTWMGYVGTTGLATMDYLVTDPYQTAPGTEACYSERWLVLPDDYICFLPAPTTPDVAPSPVLKNGFVTFGSFNNPAKLTDDTLSLWGGVLAAVPDSRLLLSYRGFGDPGVQSAIRETLADFGIAPDRISFETKRFHEEFLGGYGEIDIALDTMPYSGGLTTCEALWMGVPVVTLAAQDHFAGRHSLSHLTNAGFASWAVRSREDFVSLCRALAADQDRLARIRKALRPAVAASPLCDQGRYAQNVAELLRETWVLYGDNVAQPAC